jgi:hypothetical protein
MKDRRYSSEGAAEDLVYFGKGYSAPRHLHRRGIRLYQFLAMCALSPLVLLIAYGLTPTSAMMVVAGTINDLFWAHLKYVSLENCARHCAMKAYTLIAVPLFWISNIAIALYAVPVVTQHWHAGREAFRSGGAPYGKTASGKVRPPPGTKASIMVGAIGVVFLGGLIFGGDWLLYLLAGSDRTASRGREIPPTMIVLWTTVIMGVMQFFVAALMLCAVNALLSLKKLVRKRAPDSCGDDYS